MPAGASVTSESLWIHFRQVGAVEIGVRTIINAGFIDAIDVWGPLGVEAEVCFADIGSLLLLDATTSPRAQIPLRSYLRDGSTCTQIDRPGTVVLMPGPAGDGCHADGTTHSGA